MKRRPAALCTVFALLIAVALSAQSVNAIQQDVTVDPFSYHPFQVAWNEGDWIHGYFLVKSNATTQDYDFITFHIMNSANFTKYQANHSSDFDALVSIINKTCGTFDVQIPQTDLWYIVLENLLGSTQKQVSLYYDSSSLPALPIRMSAHPLLWFEFTVIFVVTIGIGIELLVRRNEWRQ